MVNNTILKGILKKITVALTTTICVVVKHPLFEKHFALFF